MKNQKVWAKPHTYNNNCRNQSLSQKKPKYKLNNPFIIGKNVLNNVKEK